ncbi:MAG: hypothetical protein AB7P08_18205 [Burkholderiales bacterium]
MARDVEAGRVRPTIITLAISAILFAWSAFALSGAGLIFHLPFTKSALFAITAAYLGRAVAFPLLRSSFPENSSTFWHVSSGICLVVGLVHLYGLVARWPAL